MKKLEQEQTPFICSLLLVCSAMWQPLTMCLIVSRSNGIVISTIMSFMTLWNLSLYTLYFPVVCFPAWKAPAQAQSNIEHQHNTVFGTGCCCYIAFFRHHSFCFHLLLVLLLSHSITNYLNTWAQSLFNAYVRRGRRYYWEENYSSHELRLKFIFRSFAPCLCTHVFHGAHIDFHWMNNKNKEKMKRLQIVYFKR